MTKEEITAITEEAGAACGRIMADGIAEQERLAAVTLAQFERGDFDAVWRGDTE